MAEVIAFVSGKGGMGKTALCAAIARELAASGKRVLCVDCQNIYGDLDAHLRLEAVPHLTYAEVCRGAFPLEKATRHRFSPKLAFLAAPASEESVTVEAFEGLLRQARQEFDYILLDDPRDEMRADRYCLLTAAIPTAIQGARRRADLLEVQGKTDVRLIVNYIDPKHMQVMRLTVDDVMDQVGLGLLGIVPYDWHVTVACVHGKNPHSIRKTGAAAAAERIARRLQGIQTAIPSRL